MRLYLLAGFLGIFILIGCGRQELEDIRPESRIERGEAFAGAGLFSSLAVDADGRPHVAYYHADHQSLRYGVWRDGAWALTTVDGGEGHDRGRQARLALADEGRIYIAYQDSDDAAVRLASYTEYGGWTTETVDETSFRTGEFIALALVRNQPVVAYYDGSNGDLMLARKESDEWVARAVDRHGDVGSYVSMVASVDGSLHMAYYDASHGGLKYAYTQADGTFVHERVGGYPDDATGANDVAAEPGSVDESVRDVGRWTSIQVQPLEGGDPRVASPRIVYQDVTRSQLWLAEKTPTGWEHSLIDDDGFVGSDTAFLWLSPSHMVVTYFDSTNLDLKIARHSSNGWTRRTLMSEGSVGMYNSMARLGDNRLAITTYSLTRGELLYLYVPERL